METLVSYMQGVIVIVLDKETANIGKTIARVIVSVVCNYVGM